MKHPLFYYITLIMLCSSVIESCGTSQSLEHKLNSMPQKAMLVAEVRDRGIGLDTLESLYPSGLPMFGDSVPQAYVQAWKDFVVGLADALRQAGMDWDEPYRLWGRAYFSPDGKVAHYFYAWTGDRQPSDEWKAQFRQVLEDYLSNFQFAYPMGRRFAQCGGIRLTPAG